MTRHQKMINNDIRKNGAFDGDGHQSRRSVYNVETYTREHKSGHGTTRRYKYTKQKNWTDVDELERTGNNQFINHVVTRII